jgi:uncharacterized phage protein (TIGR02220 family)
MAGDWIKMRSNLWDDPRVSRLCDLTNQTEATIIGGLYWLWATADQHTENGCMPGLTLRQIDRKTNIADFGKSLCDVGWLADDSQGVMIVRFEEHNGTSAKRRCVEAQRKANGRKLSASDADKDRTDDGQNPPNCGARERERGEINTSPKGLAGISDTDHPANSQRNMSRKPDALDVLTYLNQKAGRNYQPVSANIDFITGRLKEGATVEQCKAVINAKVKEWSADETMAKFLRPATLFSPKNFAQYVGQIDAKPISRTGNVVGGVTCK